MSTRRPVLYALYAVVHGDTINGKDRKRKTPVYERVSARAYPLMQATNEFRTRLSESGFVLRAVRGR